MVGPSLEDLFMSAKVYTALITERPGFPNLSECMH